MHSSRMRTACSLLYGGGLCPGRLCSGSPCPRGLCTGGLCLGAGSLCKWGSLSGRPLGKRPHSHCGQNDRHDKNITLPQTSFTDGNKKKTTTKNKTKDFCSIFALSVADLRGHQGCTPPGVQILYFHTVFSKKNAK